MKYAHAPKPATRAELRTRALLFLHQHPKPEPKFPNIGEEYDEAA